MKIFNQFESISEFTDYLDANSVQDCFNPDDGSHLVATKKDDVAFYGTKTFSEADVNLKFGDNKLAKMLQAELLDVQQAETETEITQSLELDVCGFFPDVAAYLSGDPCNMVSLVDTFADKEKVLNLIWQNDACAAIDAKDIQECAARVINVILGLEKIGYKVNLYYGYSAQVDDCKHVIGALVKIKNSDEYLDTLRMAYPLVSASMKRRHMFSYLEKTPNVPTSFNWGYGTPVKISKVFNAEIDGMTVVNFKDFNKKSCEQIKDYILGENKDF